MTISQKNFFCTKCSLQFGNHLIYGLHLKLLHKNEIEASSVKIEATIKNEHFESNDEILEEPKSFLQILAVENDKT